MADRLRLTVNAQLHGADGKKLLARHAFGALPAAVDELIERHVVTCIPCALEYESLRLAVELVGPVNYREVHKAARRVRRNRWTWDLGL